MDGGRSVFEGEADPSTTVPVAAEDSPKGELSSVFRVGAMRVMHKPNWRNRSSSTDDHVDPGGEPTDDDGVEMRDAQRRAGSNTRTDDGDAPSSAESVGDDGPTTMPVFAGNERFELVVDED